MSNLFAVLGESDDEDRVKVVAKKDDKKKEAAPAKATAAAPAPAAAPKAAKGDKDNKEKKAPRDSKPRGTVLFVFSNFVNEFGLSN